MPTSVIDSQSIARIWVIVPAAGSGQRMATNTPKQYLQIQGKTILETTLDLFLANDQIARVVVSLAADDLLWPTLPCASNAKVISTLGGSTRALSVCNGLVALKAWVDDADWVLVHDAARPCLSAGALNDFILKLRVHAVGGILAVPVKDTLKLSKSTSGQILKTLNRDNVWHAQTPQMFRYGLLLDAMQQALTSGHEITDEASAMELAGYSPQLIESDSRNLKVTTPEDLTLATFLLTNPSN
ncbi:MAG: 2-C-methyl-D-erythritol 4-phosphate cytidylyltransferase [Arenicella sp.]|jgi:2-C-methyl-D-erythritol 4-phosphate cytidylyltransferase